CLATRRGRRRARARGPRRRDARPRALRGAAEPWTGVDGGRRRRRGRRRRYWRLGRAPLAAGDLQPVEQRLCLSADPIWRLAAEPVKDVERAAVRAELQLTAVGRRAETTATPSLQDEMPGPGRNPAQHPPQRSAVTFLGELEVSAICAPGTLESYRTDPGNRAACPETKRAHGEDRDGIDDAVDPAERQRPSLGHPGRDPGATEAGRRRGAVGDRDSAGRQPNEDQTLSHHTGTTAASPERVPLPSFV